MIHSVEVNAEAKHDALKKLFRKKLMTGGAVVKLVPISGIGSIPVDEQQVLFDHYSAISPRGGVAELVLVGLCELDELDANIHNALIELGVSPVKLVGDDARKSFERADSWSIRRMFQTSLGDSQESIRKRVAICEAAGQNGLSDDLRVLLLRDPAPEVRFAARIVGR